MKDYIWFIYVLLVILVFLPFLRIDLYFKYKKYKKFFYINMVLILWTLMMGLRFVLINEVFVYYASLSIYPIVFGLVVLLLLAVHDYLEIKNKRILSMTLLVLWIINAVSVFTNTIHQAFIKVSYHEGVTFEIFNEAPVGIGFYIHTLLSYTLLAYVFIKLFTYFFKEFKKNNDWVPLFLITLCFGFGIMINLIHLFVYEFTIDPTLSIFIVFMMALYIIFIIRDLNLISQLNNNQFILDHYREMYLIIDINGMVVNASDELKEKFGLDDLNKKSYQEVTSIMNEKAIIFRDPKSLEHPFDKHKIYLHMKEERINLPLFKYSGKLFLFYDETDHQNLMNELNYVLYHDLMTDLYNRNYFEDYKKVLDSLKEPYGVVIFDLDGLKRTNDSHGHEAGDNLLICFANSLKDVANKYPKTTAIRLGGDEFLLIIEDQKMFNVDKIIKDINDFVKKQNNNNCIGFSYGSHLKVNDQKIAKVLRLADDALYEMKKKRYENKI